MAYEPGNTDFSFALVSALNGDSSARSFQSTSFPTYFISIANATTGDLGIIENPNVDDATWIFEAPLASVPPAATSAYSLRSASKGPFGGQYLTYSTQDTAPCAFPPPAGDAALTDGSNASRATWIIGPLPPANASAFLVDTRVVINPAVNRRFMGVSGCSWRLRLIPFLTPLSSLSPLVQCHQ